MKLILSSPTDAHLSYRLQKHPKSIYSRDLGDNTVVTGRFDENGKSFLVSVDHNIELILTHCRETNKASYNDAVFWLAGPYNLKGFNVVFRSILRGQQDETLPTLVSSESHEYWLDIGPVSNYDSAKIHKLTAGMGLNILPSQETKLSTVCNLYISGTMTLTSFLQKVYLFLYAYQYQYKLGVDKDEKLAQFKGMFESWIDDLEYKEYLFECLAGKRLYKLAKLSEEYGQERVEYVEGRVQESLHTKRHQIIAQVLKKCVGLKTILDAACGSGQLHKHLDGIEAKYIGFDANVKRTKLKLFQTNILMPYLNFEREDSAMVLSEVIEHFDKADRELLYQLVNNFYQPEVLIITTPNHDYNKIFGLDGYRHRDHKIEFNVSTIKEVFLGLTDYELISSIDMTDEEVQPSFILVFQRVTEQNLDTPEILRINAMFSGKNKMQLNKALCSNAIVQNHKDIFYLGPTIAPAPHDSESMTLESYAEAIEYYKSKGVTDLTYQVKEMGSRAYILWFRSFESANLYGYDKLFICNSRNGFSFFNDAEIENTLWSEMLDFVPSYTNVVMLDCEITPWSLKAEGLIEHMFNIPLYAEKYHLEFLNERDERLLRNVNKAIEVLHQFDNSTPEEMKIHIFDVLYMDGIPDISILGALSFFWRAGFSWKVSNHFSIIETSNDLDTILMKLKGKEGIVVKPTFRQAGILPAIKVRHPDFLRLIYGSHYQDYFDMLSTRPLSRKRHQSHQQYVTSQQMIKSFWMNKHDELLLNVLQFLSEERTIDATL